MFLHFVNAIAAEYFCLSAIIQVLAVTIAELNCAENKFESKNTFGNNEGNLNG